MAEINTLAAARTRLLRGDRETIAGAITDESDTAPDIRLVEEVYTKRGVNGNPLEALELVIAKKIDEGADYPVGNVEAFQGVRWLAEVAPSSLPSTMPRDYALYLAIAWQERGRYETVTEAMQFIFANFEFM